MDALKLKLCDIQGRLFEDTEYDSKKIYKQAPFKTMNINYLMFYTMDNEIAIDDLKEIFKQKKNRPIDLFSFLLIT